MGSGARRRSSGERVLESRHVIGLFLLMLVFSGVFFALGYVMGRNQYDGQVRAAGNSSLAPGNELSPKPRNDAAARSVKPNTQAGGGAASDTPAASEWDFYNAGKSETPSDDRLKPAADVPVGGAPKTIPAVARGNIPSKVNNLSPKGAGAPSASTGSYTLQVAALRKESEAFALASELRKRKFPAFVASPQADRYYRVQVGPYADQKSAEAARKGLEGSGFKAIVKH